jgi:hypothetical protein
MNWSFDACNEAHVLSHPVRNNFAVQCQQRGFGFFRDPEAR